MRYSLFPANDPVMTLRLKRQLMGLVSYLMFLVPLIDAVHSGWMKVGYSGLFVLTIIALAFNIGYFIAIRTGFSRRFKDPTMLLPQIVTALVLSLLMIHLAVEARSVLLMLFFTIFFFGLFGLNTRQFLWLTAVTTAGYIVLMSIEFRGQPLNTNAFRLELLRFMALVMIMLWVSFLGGYIARMRSSLANKKSELSHALEKLKELASRDELTGSFNRRHLLEIMEHEKERADRFGETFSVCILDLDHFKRFNDDHGHQVGDEVLQGFSQRMRARARGLDWLGRQDRNTFGRYGGEEFLLVLPHTTLDGALHCVERIRADVNASPFETSAGPLQPTFSAGIAEYERGETVASTLSRADAALYRAKDNGRNRTELAIGDNSRDAGAPEASTPTALPLTIRLPIKHERTSWTRERPASSAKIPKRPH
jgi:diguanylate cyclase (GGDEF)-like protein